MIRTNNFLLLAGILSFAVGLFQAVIFVPASSAALGAGAAVLGLQWNWYLGLLVAALLVTLFAWALFQRRDIRVGGERSWRISRFRRIRPVAQ